MNRNSQEHFATTPNMNIGRSKFDRSFTHKTTWNVGELTPFYVDPAILPGDTVKMDMSHITRMLTPIVPVMDNLSLDVYWFFVPNRLVWDHWAEFMGENKTAPWYQTTQYEIPQIEAPANGWSKGSLTDHFGYIPTGVDNVNWTHLPYRAYCLIWNEFFRDENLKNPAYITMGDSTVAGLDIDPTNDYVTDAEKGACLLKVAKNFDYFTAALPQAQKGPAVNIPLGQNAPIIASDETVPQYSSNPVDTDALGYPIYFEKGNNAAYGQMFYNKNDTSTALANVSSVGMVADLSNAVGATVNQLREAFAVQKWYERNAISGTRLIEIIRAHFGVTNPDFRLQRPEYLGGFRQPIQMNQVIQTDGSREYSVWDSTLETPGWVTKDGTPQGNAAAYSLTSDRKNGVFTHSFTEHGILMGLMCARVTTRTYQQGINRLWSAKDKFDLYWPEFSHLGNVGIKNKEIYAQGSNVINSDTGKPYDEEIFGYQEAWADYRYMPDVVSGEFRSNYAQSLDVWHYADYYQTMPQLSSEWIDEDDENVKRTLAIQNHDMLESDILCKAIYTRPMPLYSTPGLIDHF